MSQKDKDTVSLRDIMKEQYQGASGYQNWVDTNPKMYRGEGTSIADGAIMQSPYSTYTVCQAGDVTAYNAAAISTMTG